MDKEMRFWSDDRGSTPDFGIYFSSVIWLLYSFFVNLYTIPSIYHYYYQFLMIMISKKIILNILWSKEPLKMLVGI